MGKTRKDRKDWDVDYYKDKANKRGKKRAERRRENNQNWSQFRNAPVDDVIDECDECLVEDDC
jgi:hypothetical protein